MIWVLLFIGGLLAFGFLVDWVYKKRGIKRIEPDDNGKNAPDTERVYMEAHLDQIKHIHH